MNPTTPQAPTTSVLFVDDESRIIDGLRRQLHGKRNAWDMRFADGGAMALAMLREKPADVIVSDLNMPGMNGVELLHRVRDQWPDTVRMILSGQSDLGELTRDLGSIHQFLDKPCDGERLCAAIERTTQLAGVFGRRGELRKVAAGIKSLPVLPESHHELLSALDSSESDIERVGTIVSRDVALSVKLLQMVNSAFFGLPRTIERPRQAVALLGFRTVRFLALAGHVFDALRGEDDRTAHVKALWDRSLEISAQAGLLARRAGQGADVIERSRLAGMVSLIGRAVLIRNDLERFTRATRLVSEQLIPLHAAEAEVFGIGQHMIGAYLLGLWAFDDDVIAAVAGHVDPGSVAVGVADHPLAYVHMARCCAQPSGLCERLAPSRTYLASAGLSEWAREELAGSMIQEAA